MDLTVAAFLVSLPVGLCLAAGAVTAAEEWKWMRSSGRLSASARTEMLLSLSLVPPNILVSVLAGGAWAAAFLAAESMASWRLGFGPATVVLAFVACDLSYYWEHRCAHRVKLLWRLYHAVHHSSPACTVATAYRVSFLNQSLSPAFYLPWVLLGFPPILVLGFQLTCFHYQAWLHTEAIGPIRALDPWLNTPANHRIHHSKNARHRDRNLGAILMIWDRLFATYAPPETGLVYGIADESPPRRWWEIYLRPWWPRAAFIEERT